MFEHNRQRLRQFGRHFIKRNTSCKLCAGDCLPLAELPSGTVATIQCNHDTKTIERGLYFGARLEVYRNESSEPNLIVAVSDSRYVLDRRIAKGIRVKVS
ncbi:MAG TPA: FeoA family protein [Candidatus Cloacimonadota bacterium]|nr:FeoA family protein [Candidatus Cloacimonadota bacterium]HPS38701.1 FeoA family protein [Candidatus Cloacimonadota bacterium]